MMLLTRQPFEGVMFAIMLNFDPSAILQYVIMVTLLAPFVMWPYLILYWTPSGRGVRGYRRAKWSALILAGCLFATAINGLVIHAHDSGAGWTFAIDCWWAVCALLAIYGPISFIKVR